MFAAVKYSVDKVTAILKLLEGLEEINCLSWTSSCNLLPLFMKRSCVLTVNLQ